MFVKLTARARQMVAPPNPTRSGYLPGLDGLRALAILAVLVYHADLVWLPGGFLGVEVFFVVSGYLITLLLRNEYRKHGAISFGNFWRRRARRLLPALFVMLAAVLVWMVAFLPDEVATIRGDVVAALTYITNWYLIAAQKSYFETIGRPSLLQHLWSLAVEEQFYLLWPLVFAFLLVRLKTRGALLVLMLGATLSALWMGALYHPDTDPSRVYYGTDTRAFGLLIGAALAFVWSPQTSETKRARRHWLLDGVGFLAFLGIGAAFLSMDEFNPFLYQGGMLLVSVATAFLIAAVVHPKSPALGPLLSIGILQWIGLRSYSLYLWHWPVFMLTRPQLDTTLEGASLLGFRFALTFLLAEISFRLIESPIRGGILGRTWNGWTQTRGARRWGFGMATLVVAGLTLLGGIALGNAVANAQMPEQPDYVLALPDDPSAPQPLEMPRASEQSADVLTLPEEQSAPLPLEMPRASEPIASAADQVGSPVSSEMTSVSFVMPADLMPTDTEIIDAASIAVSAPPVVDAWVNKLNLARGEVVDAWVRKLRLAATPTATARATDAAKMDAAENDFESALGVYLWREQKRSGACRVNCLTTGEIHRAQDAVLNPITPPKPAASAQAPVIAPTVPIPHPSQVQVLALGDSVMLGASNYLRKSVNAILVDAKLGRQVSTAIRLLQAYKDENRLPPVIIIHLGNNGTFTTKQFQEMMNILADTPRVVFLTTKVPRKWQDANNSALFEGARLYPNVQIVDWNSASAAHPEWFWKDGIHLRPEGAQFYTNLITATLEQPLAP